MTFARKVVLGTALVAAVAGVVLHWAGRASERSVRAALEDAAAAWNRGDEARVCAYVSPRAYDAQRIWAEVADVLRSGSFRDVRIESADVTIAGEQADVGLRFSAQTEVRRVPFRIRLRLERHHGDPAWRVVDGERPEPAFP
jgi:predicted lipid-binding transport protein (Tim44 family)